MVLPLLLPEDSIIGVTATTAAGMTAPAFVGAAQVFDDMAQLPALVNQWTRRVTLKSH